MVIGTNQEQLSTAIPEEPNWPANVVENEDGSVTLKLRKPLPLAKGEEVAELRLPRPTAAHLEAMDDAKGEVGKAVRLISSLASIPASAVRRMDGADFLQAQEIANHFLGKSLSTGETS